MKRIISVLLILTAIIFACSVPGSALSTDEDWDALEERGFLYAVRYFGEDYRSTEYNSKTEYDPNGAFYDELYYHRDENGEIDWALIRANKGYAEASEACSHYGKYFMFGNSYKGFSLGIGLYDVREDRFFNISNDPYWDVYSVFDDKKYDGFTKAIEALTKMPQSRTGLYYLTAGDMDASGEITILDATYIQRFLAGFPYWSCGGHASYGAYEQSDMADYDCDGEATILDATAIRRHLAGIE